MTRSNNMIVGLRDVNGDRQTSEEDITNTIIQYFTELFTTSHPSGMDNVLDCVQP